MQNSFYSGFSLKNEKELFSSYLTENDFTVSGFSYGAQKAFEYVLNTSNRVDKLQFFSPAFFQNKNDKYKRMQLMFFNKDSNKYCDNFLENCTKPNKISLVKYFEKGTLKELEELLSYSWEEEKLQKLKDKNIKIEVFLGSDDKIIEAATVNDFFTPYATVYYIKNVGHVLN